MKFAEEAAEPGYAARGPGGTDGPPLIDLLATALSEEAWESFSRGSAIRRAGRTGFARNVCVAMGNWLATVDKGGWGRTEDTGVEMLVRALSDSEPLVRGHAAWALGQTPSNRAREALGEQLATERDRGVREELELVLTA